MFIVKQGVVVHRIGDCLSPQRYLVFIMFINQKGLFIAFINQKGVLNPVIVKLHQKVYFMLWLQVHQTKMIQESTVASYIKYFKFEFRIDYFMGLGLIFKELAKLAYFQKGLIIKRVIKSIESVSRRY